MTVVVAIDGPAGSGKSSVSRAAARQLGFNYQDSGAAYRAFAWHVLESGIDVGGIDLSGDTVSGDTARVDSVLAAFTNFDYTIGVHPDDYFVSVGETDVTTAIRDARVTAAVSAVAGIPAVRSRLVELFRGVIATSDKPGIITEGRDITTVVAPDASVRILLTASEEARMARRSAETPEHSATVVASQISARDAQDSRVVDFMNAAEGVTTLDSTNLDFDQTVSAVVALVRGSYI